MASSQHEEAEERRRRKEAKKGQAGGKETPVMDGQSCEERREIREELRKLLDEISKKNQVRAWVGRALLAPRLRTLTPLGPPHTPFHARARAEPTRHSSHTCVYGAFEKLCVSHLCMCLAFRQVLEKVESEALLDMMEKNDEIFEKVRLLSMSTRTYTHTLLGLSTLTPSGRERRA
jgi:hypothetical protein